MADKHLKGRWFRFSLRTLLIAVLVLSLPLSWLVARMERARRQRLVVETVRDLDGFVHYDYEAAYYKGADDRPPLMSSLLGVDFCSNVVCIDLRNNPRVTDAELPTLEGMNELWYLYLDHTAITDAGIKNLEALSQLRCLTIQETRITDAGLAKLRAALPNCQIEY